MQNCAKNHDTSIFVLALVALGFKVKDFDGSIFASGKKPFVLFLELHGHSVSVDSIEDPFLVKMSGVEYFDVAVRACADVFSVMAQTHLGYGVFTRWLAFFGSEGLDIPELYLFVVSCGGQNNLTPLHVVCV